MRAELIKKEIIELRKKGRKNQQEKIEQIWSSMGC
jgi:hypothetical protein